MSHRFKAFSPPFCAKNRFRLVPTKNFAKIFFDRALNRRSQDGVPRAFYVTFCTPQKVTTRTPLPGVPRFSKTRISPPKKQLRTNKLKFFCRSVSLKHGRLAHVRSQFSLFRRSPTHKNLPQAAFCTSERAFAPSLAATVRRQRRRFPAASRLLYPTSPDLTATAAINFGKTDKMYKKCDLPLDRTVFLCYTIANKKRSALHKLPLLTSAKGWHIT